MDQIFDLKTPDAHLTESERNRIRNLRMAEVRHQLETWDGQSGDWFWLSFCDTNKPKDQQFLGAAIIKAPSPLAAGAVAALFGCHPGGEAIQITIRPEVMARVNPKWLCRLLTREECAAMDQEFALATRPDVDAPPPSPLVS